MRTYGTRRTRIPATQYLSSIALLVSVIVALLVGALAGMVADAFELALGAAMVIGLATLTALAALVLTVVRQVNHTWNYYKP
jgi:ABC-type dipeptide/oligopeptide/nickel transport system permease component